MQAAAAGECACCPPDGDDGVQLPGAAAHSPTHQVEWRAVSSLQIYNRITTYYCVITAQLRLHNYILLWNYFSITSLLLHYYITITTYYCIITSPLQHHYYILLQHYCINTFHYYHNTTYYFKFIGSITTALLHHYYVLLHYHYYVLLISLLPLLRIIQERNE